MGPLINTCIRKLKLVILSPSLLGKVFGKLSTTHIIYRRIRQHENEKSINSVTKHVLGLFSGLSTHCIYHSPNREEIELMFGLFFIANTA